MKAAAPEVTLHISSQRGLFTVHPYNGSRGEFEVC